MATTLQHWAYGKYHAARSLTEFLRYFRNWREVWAAYRARRPLPPLVLNNGLTLHHGPGDDPIFLFREIFLEHSYDSDGFYCPSPTDTVLDLGGNIGFFALFVQWKARGARVHSFEPCGDTFARLAHNVAANGLGGAVTPHRLAVAGASGEVRLKRGKDAGKSSLFASEYTEAASEEEVVPCVDFSGAVAL